MLVAYPDEIAADELRYEREWLNGFFSELSDEPVHLEMARFTAKEAMEATVERWIGNICTIQSAFEMRLNNFSSLPPHTIYARIQDQLPFLNFVSKLKFLDDFIQSGNCPPVQFASKAFIPIGSRLPDNIYEEAVKFYSARTFQASFLLTKLGLLKNRGGDDGVRLIQTFSLHCFIS